MKYIPNICQVFCLFYLVSHLASAPGATVDRGRAVLNLESESFWSTHEIFLAEIIDIEYKGASPARIKLRPSQTFTPSKTNDLVELAASDVGIPEYEWMGNPAVLFVKGKSVLICREQTGTRAAAKFFASDDDRENFTKMLHNISKIRAREDKAPALMDGLQSPHEIFVSYCLGELLNITKSLQDKKLSDQLRLIEDNQNFSAPVRFKAYRLREKLSSPPNALQARTEWLQAAINNYDATDSTKWLDRGGRDLLFCVGELENALADKNALAEFFISMANSQHIHPNLRHFGLGALHRCITYGKPTDKTSIKVLDFWQSALKDKNTSIRSTAAQSLRNAFPQSQDKVVMRKIVEWFEQAALTETDDDTKEYLRSSAREMKEQLNEFINRNSE